MDTLDGRGMNGIAIDDNYTINRSFNKTYRLQGNVVMMNVIDCKFNEKGPRSTWPSSNENHIKRFFFQDVIYSHYNLSHWINERIVGYNLYGIGNFSPQKHGISLN